MNLITDKKLQRVKPQTISLAFYRNYITMYSLIKEILSCTSENANIDNDFERSFPGDEEHRKSGYYKKMLKRYFFPGDFFCRKKSVLDSCSGMGWGTYILSHFARDVTAFDKSEDSINFCREQWRAKNISWHIADALKLPTAWENEFDVAFAMESIEHFSREDGGNYIKNLAGSLKDNGYLIGTSAFPNSRERADEICQQNPHHLYIFTLDEISEILNHYFDQYKIINNWMFIGKK